MTKYIGNYQLDARPDRIDLRDRIYLPPLRSLAHEFPESHYVTKYFSMYKILVLDQGKEGACTGFGLACAINYLLWWRALMKHEAEQPNKKFNPPAQVSQRMLYHLARFYDEWPGEDYEGSSCRGAVKAWYKHGVCSLKLWPYRDNNNKAAFVKPMDGWEIDAAERPLGVYYRIDKNSITDMRAAIQEVGAIFVSAQVHKGWDLKKCTAKKVNHKSLPRIAWKADTERQGGHAFALVGFNRRGFIVQNSWGPGWGLKGFAILAYDDWGANGKDAWVCVMGAPTETNSKKHFILSQVAREQLLFDAFPTTFELFRRQVKEHQYQNPVVQPWDEGKAYEHSLVMGNDGRVINRLVENEGPLDTVDEIMVERPSLWLSQQEEAKKQIVIFAHGGLNSEGDSIRRIQTLAPYFIENGIYPLFLTWKTGLLESIVAIMDDSVGRLVPRSEGLGDVFAKAKEMAVDIFDRTIEVASENLGVKAIWSQMKQNAAASAQKGNNDRGSFLTVKALTRLKKEHPTLKIHLVGHSAGALLLGHLLKDCPRNSLKIASCTLYAAACSVDFANKHYAWAVGKNVLKKKNLHMHLLSDQREKDDTVGPYKKSLLYLVSRALENWHKTPLLGMVNVFDQSFNDKKNWSKSTHSHLRSWQSFWGNQGLEILDDEQVVTVAEWMNGELVREISKENSAHGSFDNDIKVVDQTIQRIIGKPLEHSVENLRY
ncbi:C1 family peptidase [Desulfocapsa sp. AH-315-G09]|nr:C1 family peptidase [Desulfocapsa sp.]MBN4065167.1 C1 family peptidase [Desulfocapsa sp. AH-315-G09]